MSILAEINELLDMLNVPVETGYFSDKAPEQYCLLTPLNQSFVYSNNIPQIEVSEVRISLFSKNNYLSMQRKLVKVMLLNDFVVTEIRFIEFENDTKYYHVAIDIAKHKEMEEEEWQQ